LASRQGWSVSRSKQIDPMAPVGVPMGKRNWIFVGVIAFALVVFLAWAFWTPHPVKL